jgi:hypothetical protein
LDRKYFGISLQCHRGGAGWPLSTVNPLIISRQHGHVRHGAFVVLPSSANSPRSEMLATNRLSVSQSISAQNQILKMRECPSVGLRVRPIASADLIGANIANGLHLHLDETGGLGRLLKTTIILM